VLHPIRKLARAIHRRSVWQVLGGFLLMTWGVVAGADALTHSAGLPGWTPRMALVLMLLGLPVVLSTTIVQGGLPWLRIRDVVDPNERVGLTPEEVHVIPEAHPMYGTSLLTWRNAILGGVMAGALLVTSVVAYLTMWALGIGPVGSLIAQGALDPGDPVLVADFESRVVDARVARRVTEGVRGHLARSSVITVVTREQLADALARAGYPGSTTLGREAALALMARAEVAAVVVGEVAAAGSGFRISASVLGGDGAVLASQVAIAEDTEQLESEVRVLSARLREKLGESLRAIRASDAGPGL